MNRRRYAAALVDDVRDGYSIRRSPGIERCDGTHGVGFERAESADAAGLGARRSTSESRGSAASSRWMTRMQSSMPLQRVAQFADCRRQFRAGGIQVVDDDQELRCLLHLGAHLLDVCCAGARWDVEHRGAACVGEMWRVPRQAWSCRCRADRTSRRCGRRRGRPVASASAASGTRACGRPAERSVPAQRATAAATLNVRIPGGVLRSSALARSALEVILTGVSSSFRPFRVGRRKLLRTRCPVSGRPSG